MLAKPDSLVQKAENLRLSMMKKQKIALLHIGNQSIFRILRDGTVVKVLASQSTGLIRFPYRGIPKTFKTVSTASPLDAQHERDNVKKNFTCYVQ